jgi:2,3-dihydroxybenzoate decarboxylase
MGETIPFLLWRFDSRWEISNRGDMRLDLKPSEYFQRNVWFTTSGVCADEPLRCSIDTVGLDRVMFSVDYPFERPLEAGEWIEAADLSDDERLKVCYQNAKTLLKL